MSFQQGLSGLNSTSKNLDVIGNNIANASTYGAKSARAEFASLYAASLNGAGGGNENGIGVTVATVATQFTQGNITGTGNPLDLAINGSGFFQTQNSVNQTLYTRNGQFKLDKNGFIVNNQGNKLMGYAADTSGVPVQGKMVPLQLPTGGIAPVATSKNTIQFNLDAREAITKPVAGSATNIDFTDQKTFNKATSVTMFDAKGQDVPVTYYFQKTAADTWDVYATANGVTVGGTAAAPAPITTLQFSADGATLVSPSPMPTFDIPAGTSSAGASTLPITGITLDMGGSTQFGSTYGVTNMVQDGYTAGELTGVTVDETGHLVARYSNGQTKTAGLLQVANFRNPQGLQALGGNAWSETFASGQPLSGTPGQGNLGVLQSGALEDSNVDLTAELVAMITAQRDYQANAQTIKTMDQSMQTLVNLR